MIGIRIERELLIQGVAVTESWHFRIFEMIIGLSGSVMTAEIGVLVTDTRLWCQYHGC